MSKLNDFRDGIGVRRQLKSYINRINRSHRYIHVFVIDMKITPLVLRLSAVNYEFLTCKLGNLSGFSASIEHIAQSRVSQHWSEIL